MFISPQEAGIMSQALAPLATHSLQGHWEPIYRSRLHYLVTWSTRGRKSVLKPKHAEKLRHLLAQVCEERGMEPVESYVGTDHVHVLFSLKPAQSVASAVRELKGRTGLTLLADHPELRVWLGGNLAWDEHYAIETVSPVRLERLRDALRARHAAPDFPLAAAG
jgi:putative transposase